MSNKWTMPIPRNTTPLANWFWKYVWILEGGQYKLSELPHIALETEAMEADPDNDDQRYYIDYVVENPVEEGLIFVHMDETIQH